MRIALISDTHGLLRENVIDKLNSCNLIIHAGDIGKSEVISKLSNIAKLEYVKGNCDKNLGENIGEYNKIIEVNNTKIYITHDIAKLESDIKKGKVDLGKENIDIVIYGHSHKCNIFTRSGILYINPGSVGPRRFKLPTTMAILYIREREEKSDKNIYDFYKNKKIKVLSKEEKIDLEENRTDEFIYNYGKFKIKFIDILN